MWRFPAGEPLRLSHLFPRQPDGQSQRSGPTHLPPFMHTGSHTPGGQETGKCSKLQCKNHAFRCESLDFREKSKRRVLTFLAAPPRVSLQTGADVVPHAHAAIFTRWTANSCEIEVINLRTSQMKILMPEVYVYRSDTACRRNREDTRRCSGEHTPLRSDRRASTELEKTDWFTSMAPPGFHL